MGNMVSYNNFRYICTLLKKTFRPFADTGYLVDSKHLTFCAQVEKVSVLMILLLRHLLCPGEETADDNIHPVSLIRSDSRSTGETIRNDAAAKLQK